MSKAPTIDDASLCMKCGFCMSNCPVYIVDHIESHVARGRNMLIKQARNKEIALDDEYYERLSYCLLCGRCEAVCLARVPSPDINIAARTELVKQKGLPFWQRLIYRGILKDRPLMARLMGLAALVPGLSQKGGRPLRHMADFASLFTKGISLPRLSRPFLAKRLPEITQPPEGVAKKGTVAIFPGCAFEFFFADTGERIARDLAEAGYEVVYPQGLACCGLAVRSAGDLETAKEMAKKNIEALAPYDVIITGCATCSSALKDYGKWFDGDEQWQGKAESLSSRVSDFSDFMAKQGLKPQAVEPLVVTYHDPCHLSWHQGIREQPRQLLKSIEGVKFVEMEGADECCGMGGSFSLAHRDTSLAIQDKKMESIKKTGAQVVVTSCPGCIIQLRDGARRHGMDIEVKHISELIQGQKEPPRKPR
jgi:glycolate oxidase iron-sulfur subunit